MTDATAHLILRGPGSPFKRMLDKISSGKGVPAAELGKWAKISCQALADCVVACASDDKALHSLRDLLNTEQVTTDYVIRPEDNAMQGTPLYLAAKLDLAAAAEILLDHGASMVHPFEDETPIECAMRLKHTTITELFFSRIRDLQDDSRVAQPNFDSVADGAKPASSRKRKMTR